MTPTPPEIAVLIDRLEKYYEFQCPGGPLKNCIEWQQLSAALRAETQARQEAETEIRQKLWLNHGCGLPALYGDDGELQCGNGHPFHRALDFKREQIPDLLLGVIGAFSRRLEAERVARQQAEQERDEWRDAVIDAAVVNWTYQKAHETDPRAAIHALLCQAQREALDPVISEEAAKLHAQLTASEQAREKIQTELHYWLKRVPLSTLSDDELARFRTASNLSR